MKRFFTLLVIALVVFQFYSYRDQSAYGATLISWQKPVTADTSGSAGIDSISCPGLNYRVALAYLGNYMIYDGTSWSSP